MQSENGESQFVMHDLISDLAKSVAGQQFLHLENKMEHNKNYINLQDTCHVSYSRNSYEIFKKFDPLNEAEKLRSFIALPVYHNFYRQCCLTKQGALLFAPKIKIFKGAIYEWV